MVYEFPKTFGLVLIYDGNPDACRLLDLWSLLKILELFFSAGRFYLFDWNVQECCTISIWWKVDVTVGADVI